MAATPASDFVPQRTAEGESCLIGAHERISGKQRQLLRLVDGQRSLRQIAQMLPGRDPQAELQALVALGLVTAAEPDLAAPAVAPPAGDALPERWPEALVYMVSHAQALLGVMAQPVIQRLESAAEASAARGAIARWHMALRESRYGREVADARLQVVSELLQL